jgi:hypothetical protein
MKEEQKQHLVDIMKSDEELGLYEQEIKLEDIFNDEKKENLKKFIDEINNPAEPNQALKDAAEMYNEEDLKTAFLDGWELRDGDLPFSKAKNKWFNEFKKK